MMAKYVSRPREVQAVRWPGEGVEVKREVSRERIMEWLEESGCAYLTSGETVAFGAHGGWRTAEPGHWIVLDRGRLQLWADHDFVRTFEEQIVRAHGNSGH